MELRIHEANLRKFGQKLNQKNGMNQYIPGTKTLDYQSSWEYTANWY